MSEKEPLSKKGAVRLTDGMVEVTVWDTAKDLTEELVKRYPKQHFPSLVYGNYEPDPTYIKYGVLHLSKEASPGLVAHEIYHAVRHVARVKNPGFLANRDGLLSKSDDRKEEREADMFGQLFNQIWEVITGVKP